MKARLLAATLAVAPILAAAPASAQVNGIAVTDPAIAIASAQALQTAYAQIGTTFQAQRTQLEQVQEQRAGLLRQFDTNNDGQLNEEEQRAAQANTAVLQQIQGLDQQINTIQQPITQARVYVIEQLLMQYSAALQQVTTQNNIQLVLNPNNVVWTTDTVDITQKIAAALNQLAPTVSTSVPQGWQPNRQSVALYQEVQDILLSAAVQQAQQAQQQGQAAPAQQGQAAPAPAQPVGR
ncbi:MAG: OmpH family outer membrane protein [Altererythrobacter sp.]|nr:OmpH family outer membrane protein [Altererythrobacter sp.]